MVVMNTIALNDYPTATAPSTYLMDPHASELSGVVRGLGTKIPAISIDFVIINGNVAIGAQTRQIYATLADIVDLVAVCATNVHFKSPSTITNEPDAAIRTIMDVAAPYDDGETRVREWHRTMVGDIRDG
jgi:hypothetical protein